MPKEYLCLCQAINTLLCCSRYVLILPLKSMNNKNNHLNIGCTFSISKFWFCISVISQFVLAIYVLITTFIRLGFEAPVLDTHEWYLMTIGYMIMKIDILTSLTIGTLKAKRIGKLLEKICHLNGTLAEMRTISRQIKFVILFLLIGYLISISSFIYVACIRLDQFNSITWKNILDSPFGLMFRGVLSIVTQIQCALIVSLCLIISSKFQHLADTIKSTLNHATFFSSSDQTKTARKIKTTTIKWMSSDEADTSNIVHLEYISDQHQEAMFCLSEINDCFGLQLLVTFSALLFTTVYYLYRSVTLNPEYGYMSNDQQRYHCVITLIFHLSKLLLYIFVGQKICKQCKEPVREMQRGKLLCLPVHSQQQIQNLIMQWLSMEPCHLSAYNVINIGPWLLAPIVGNTVTYLLVALQFKNSSEVSKSEISNLT